MTDEQKTSSETWREVGDQFRKLGQSLATACRAAWENEDNRQHVQEMRAGLEGMVNDVGRVIQEVSATPEAQRARGEVTKAAESARAAGEHAWQEAQPHVLSALQQINAELQNIVSRTEAKDSGSDPAA